MKTKTLKAPEWFLKLHNEMDKVEKEMADILGVGTHWLAQQQGKSISGLVKDKNLSETVLSKLKVIHGYRNALSQYTWGRFRYDHRETEIGLASHLHFDREKEKIIARGDPFEKIQKFIKKTLDHFRGVKTEIGH